MPWLIAYFAHIEGPPSVPNDRETHLKWRRVLKQASTAERLERFYTITQHILPKRPEATHLECHEHKNSSASWTRELNSWLMLSYQGQEDNTNCQCLLPQQNFRNLNLEVSPMHSSEFQDKSMQEEHNTGWKSPGGK